VLYGEKNFRHSWKLAGVNGNKLIATLHHPAEHNEWLFRSTRHLSFLSHAIVMSEALRAFAEDLVGKGRVSVVPYGVDVNYFRPIDERRQPAPRLVFAGFHERDYEVLSQVVEIVVRSHDSAEFLMISKDPRCEEIARRFPARADVWRNWQTTTTAQPFKPATDGVTPEAQRRLHRGARGWPAAYRC
jgi:glycosyltransferase involved in cell wall biosynthesis